MCKRFKRTKSVVSVNIFTYRKFKIENYQWKDFNSFPLHSYTHNDSVHIV